MMHSGEWTPRSLQWMCPDAQGNQEHRLTKQPLFLFPLPSYATHDHRCNSATTTNKPHRLHHHPSHLLLRAPCCGLYYHSFGSVKPQRHLDTRSAMSGPLSTTALMKPWRTTGACHSCSSPYSPLRPSLHCRKFWNHRASSARFRWKATLPSNEDKHWITWFM